MKHYSTDRRCWLWWPYGWWVVSLYGAGAHDHAVLLADQKRIRELERELRRKDKALAEAAALLILRKKLNALWGDDAGED